MTLMRVGFLPLLNNLGASSRYRVFQFLDPLEGAGFHCKVLDAPQGQMLKRAMYLPRLLSIIANHDVIVVQKRILPQWLLRMLTRAKVRIIFDMDDAVYLSRRLEPGLNAMLRAATAVIVGNEQLAAYSRKFNENTVIIPTVVDTTLYCPRAPARHSSDSRVVIGWIGLCPNRGDLQSIRAVLDWVGSNYGDRVVLRTVGRRPLDMKTNLAVEFVPWTLDGSAKELQEFDIGIMPLEDTVWNRGKCGCKLIQYMAVGAAAIASPVGANREIVEHGVSGFLASTDIEWQTSLSKLIENTSLRQQIGLQARARALKHYSIDAALPRLTTTLRRALTS